MQAEQQRQNARAARPPSSAVRAQNTAAYLFTGASVLPGEGRARTPVRRRARPPAAQPSVYMISIRPLATTMSSWLIGLDVHTHCRHTKVGPGHNTQQHSTHTESGLAEVMHVASDTLLRYSTKHCIGPDGSSVIRPMATHHARHKQPLRGPLRSSHTDRTCMHEQATQNAASSRSHGWEWSSMMPSGWPKASAARRRA